MLTKYEKLMDKIEQRGIWVDKLHTSKKIPTASMAVGDELAIFIDDSQFETDTERRWALAHEYAHCVTGAFYKENSSETEYLKSEYRAVKKTVQENVSFEKYKRAVKSRCRTDSEFADFWDVPIKDVAKIHMIYERTRWDEVQKLKRDTLSDDI